MVGGHPFMEIGTVWSIFQMCEVVLWVCLEELLVNTLTISTLSFCASSLQGPDPLQVTCDITYIFDVEY